jgi:hypothetical protein
VKWFFHQYGEQLGNWKTAWNGTLKRAGLRVKLPGSTKWINLVKFHDTRRTFVTNMDEMDLQEKDMMRVGGHKTPEMNRRYNQSKKAAGRVTAAQNAALGLGVTQPEPNEPASPNGDWKAELRELKAMLDDGTLSAEEFALEKARVLASR